MPNSYSGQVCLITGGASGIGKELVLAFLTEGATVHALDVSQKALDLLKEELAHFPHLHLHCLDVSDRAAVLKTTQNILHQSKRIDLLINNAGITLLEETHHAKFEDWKRILDVNYHGALLLIGCVYPHMITQKSGHIVNVASIAGHAGYCTASAYATSKAALIGFSHTLASEAHRHQIKISIVYPSYVQTNLFSGGKFEVWKPSEIASTFLTPPLSPKEAAQHIIKGIRKKKSNIIFPLSGLIFFLLSSWFPTAAGILQKRLLTKYRRHHP